MARLKKDELIKELTNMGVSYSGDMKYNDLYKLYKDKIAELENTELNAVYTYEPEPDDELIKDKPSTPVELIQEVKVNVFKNEPEKIKSDKELFEKFIKSNKDFYVTFNGERIFSSKETDLSNIKPIDEYFTVYGKKYSYRGAGLRYF